MSELRVSAILLAAGESHRMGRPKALLDWEGTSLLQYQLAQLTAVPEIREIIVVTGHEPEPLAAVVATTERARAVHNAGYRSGKVSSIRAGLAAIAPDADAVLLLGVDQPRPAAILRAVVDTWSAGHAPIVIPAHNGRAGHPVLFDRSLFAELDAIAEDTRGIRAIRDRHAAETQVVELTDPSVNLDLNSPDDVHRARDFRAALDILSRGGIVALPTDTVYGLVAVAADRAAVERIYEVKRRDPAQAMPLFVASVEQAALIAELTDTARLLAARFWPGALTIVLRKKPQFETRAAAGEGTIALRAPGELTLRELAAQLGPLTGTSANIAGREECHTATEVRAQLGDSADLVVDAAVDAHGRPSTIVDCTGAGIVRVLRDGAVSREALVEALAGAAALV